MQPYFFPYIGYYQLACAADVFVFLDDVGYIKKGYINRNSILLDGEVHDFSLPVSKISQNKKICEHKYINDFSRFLRVVEVAYAKSRYFDDVMPLVESVVCDEDMNVARKNAKSLIEVFGYLGLEREFGFSSDISLSKEEKGSDRIIALCQALGFDQYINAAGGRGLYQHSVFKAAGVDLKFLETKPFSYSQRQCGFIPNLSVIDVLMRCGKEEVCALMGEYLLV